MIYFEYDQTFTQEKCADLIELLCDSFPGNRTALYKNFSKIITEMPGQKWQIARSGGNIVGALLLLDREMNFKGITLSVCGLSFMAIRKDFQKSIITHTFIEKINEMSKGRDLALGFARRKMDGYWTSHGFVGISDFGELKIYLDDMTIYDYSSRAKICDYEDKYRYFLSSIYDQNDEIIVGNLKRTDHSWRAILGLRSAQVDLKLFFYDEEPVGYAFFRDNAVLEIRCYNWCYENVAVVLKSYFRKKNFCEIVFQTHLNDPFLYYLSRFSHRTNQRYSYEGGHILRINNIQAFLKKTKSVHLKNFEKLNVSEFSLEDDEISCFYSEKILTIKFRSSISLIEQTKFIFGTRSFSSPVMASLFPKPFTQIPTVDHF